MRLQGELLLVWSAPVDPFLQALLGPGHEDFKDDDHYDGDIGDDADDEDLVGWAGWQHFCKRLSCWIVVEAMMTTVAPPDDNDDDDNDDDDDDDNDVDDIDDLSSSWTHDDHCSFA